MIIIPLGCCGMRCLLEVKVEVTLHEIHVKETNKRETLQTSGYRVFSQERLLLYYEN